MYTLEQHVDDLLAHVDRVRQNARFLAKRLVEAGRSDFARILLARAHVHDASKWHGIEWDQLHMGPDNEGPELEAAIRQHQKTNDHHPEFHGSIGEMPEAAIAEMVADWAARAQEFATDLRDWVKTQAAVRYEFDKHPKKAKQVWAFIDMLLPPKFGKRKRT
jgi:hypothetical protein